VHTDDREQVGPVYIGERYVAVVVRVRGAAVFEVWRADAATLQDQRRVVTTNDQGVAVRVAQGLQRVRMYGEERAA
jgi:hypothetical protein